MPGWLRAIYRVLLFAYPREFREHYGAEMMRVFEEKTRDAFAGAGSVGVTRCCGHMMVDLAVSALRERVGALRKVSLVSIRMAMLSSITLSLAVLWFGVRGARSLRDPPGNVALLSIGILGIYGLIALLATQNWGRSGRAVVADATLHGMVAGGLMAAFSSFAWVLPAGSAVETGSAGATLLILAVLWLSAGYRAGRESGSVFRGVLAAGWTGIVLAVVKVSAGLLLWSLAVSVFPSFYRFLAVYSTRASEVREELVVIITMSTVEYLVLAPLIGFVMGAIGGGFGAWVKRARKPAPSLSAW